MFYDETQGSTGANNKLHFNFLPPFAQWILNQQLDEYVRLQLELSRKEQIPLLRHFDRFSEEDLHAIGRQTAGELLEALAQNKAGEFIRHSVERWVSNQLPVVDKYNIVADDIGLVTLVRRQTFRLLLQHYTKDVLQFRNTMIEVDRFTTFSDIAAFNALFKIQQEQKQQIDQLLEDQRLELLEAQDLAQMGSFYWDLVHRERSHFTPNTLHIFELEKTDGLERFLQDVHPQDREKLTRAMEEAINNSGVFDCEYRYQRQSHQKKIWSRGKVFFEGNKAVAMKGTVMDITDRWLLQEKLERNEALFKNAEALTHIGNWSWNIADNSIQWSDEMYRIYGLEPQSETISFERFLSFIHPAHRKQRLQEIEKALATGGADDYILKIVTPEGVEKTLQGKGHVVKDAEAKPVAFNGTCQDITREYEIQSELKQQSLLLEQKNRELERINEDLESFNYAASHDLQEPLRKIQLYSNMITEEQLLSNEKAALYFNKINAAAARMKKLIENLLLFSQGQSDSFPVEPADLNLVLQEAIELLAQVVDEKAVRITKDPLPVMLVIPFQLQQVMLNLLNNAIKFKRPGIPPVIRVKYSLVQGPDPLTSKSRFARITVYDNGTGFDPAHSEKIFGLFSRLHSSDSYSGTGIGLAICKKIIQQHQGFIRATSDGKTGSAFHIYLPAERICE